jgi:hypothetical protein
VKGVQLLVINANDVNAFPDDSFPNMQERSNEKGFNFPYPFDESKLCHGPTGRSGPRKSSSSISRGSYVVTASSTTTMIIQGL